MVEWIKPNINVDFIGSAKYAYWVSGLMVSVSLLAMVFNVFVRGSALNYGTDFRGGSQITIEFAKPIDIAKIRAALDQGGFPGAEVVSVEGNVNHPHMFMIRLGEVSAFSPEQRAQAEQSVVQALGSDLVKFEVRDAESDRVYIKVKSGLLSTPEQVTEYQNKIVAAFAQSKMTIQQAQLFGRMEDGTFEVTLGGLADEINKVFKQSLGADAVKSIPSIESVGAKAGKQLRNDGIKAVVFSLLLMLVYIGIRFDFRYAPGAIIALAHDVIIAVGIFAVFWLEFSLPVIAALLTIAGYSINDTIVTFDRIREDVGKFRDRKFPVIVNTAINETLSRTVLTALTVFISCIAILVAGTSALQGFAIALTIGVVVGCYSSIYVAIPLVIVFDEKFSSAGR